MSEPNKPFKPIARKTRSSLTAALVPMMEAGVLFVQCAQPDESLGQFARRIFSHLAAADVEERESSNYAQGHYFQAILPEAEIKIMYTDDGRLSQYRFWMEIKSRSNVPTILEAMAKQLTELGYGAFIPTSGWSRITWDGSGAIFKAQ